MASIRRASSAASVPRVSTESSTVPSDSDTRGPSSTREARAVALRVVARIVHELDGAEPRGSATARVFDALVARQPASIGSLIARAMPEGWCFTKAPVRRG